MAHSKLSNGVAGARGGGREIHGLPFLLGGAVDNGQCLSRPFSHYRFDITCLPCRFGYSRSQTKITQPGDLHLNISSLRAKTDVFPGLFQPLRGPGPWLRLKECLLIPQRTRPTFLKLAQAGAWEPPSPGTLLPATWAAIPQALSLQHTKEGGPRRVGD